jgi:hypothetical protein
MAAIESENGLFQPQQVTHGILHLDYLTILSVIYFSGIFLLFFKLLFSIIRLIRIRRTAEIYSLGNLKIMKTNHTLPFSFFNMVFMPKSDFEPMVLDHEMTHVRQFHWLDLIILELISMLLWFNPFVVLYKSALKLQHEYLADYQVIEHGNQVENYLGCLLQRVQVVSSGGPVSYFYCKTIKKRIIMITNNKTSKKYLGLYMLTLPLVCILLLAFAGNPGNSFGKTSVIPGYGENSPSIYPVNSKKVTKINGYENGSIR